MCTIHPVASREEVRTVTRLAAEIWTEHYTPIIGSSQVQYMLDTLQSFDGILKSIEDGTVYWLIKEADVEVGYLSYQEEASALFLSKFYLKKETRGKGIGRKVFSELEKTAQSIGKTAIHLTVNRHNADSIAVYHKMGFHITGEKAADIGGGYVMDDYLMEKKI